MQGSCLTPDKTTMKTDIQLRAELKSCGMAIGNPFYILSLPNGEQIAAYRFDFVMKVNK